jgi:hypothetical protein
LAHAQRIETSIMVVRDKLRLTEEVRAMTADVILRGPALAEPAPFDRVVIPPESTIQLRPCSV